MAESKRQSGEEALDAQVAQLSRELESDAAGDPPKTRTPTATAGGAGGLSTVSAGEHQDTDGGIAELDDALFAAAPTLEAAELAEALGHLVNETGVDSPATPAGPDVTQASPNPATASPLPNVEAEAAPEAIDALMDQVSEDLAQVAAEVESVRAEAGAAGLLETPTPIARREESEPPSTPAAAVAQVGQAAQTPEDLTNEPRAAGTFEPVAGDDSPVRAEVPGADAAAPEAEAASAQTALNEAAPVIAESRPPAAALDTAPLPAPSRTATSPDAGDVPAAPPSAAVEPPVTVAPDSGNAGPAPTTAPTTTIEALDTHLAETAAEVLAEAQRREAELTERSPAPEAVATGLTQPESGAGGTPGNQMATQAGAPGSAVESEDVSFAAPEQVATASATEAANAKPAAPADQAAGTDPGTAAQSAAAAPAAVPSTQGGAPASAAPGKPASAAQKPEQGAGQGGKAAAKTEALKDAAPEKPKVTLGQRLKPVAALALSPLIRLTDKLPTKTRQTLGFVAIVTLLNACALWGFLMLRSPDASAGGEVNGAVPLLKPGDPAPPPAHEAAPGAEGAPAAGSHGKAAGGDKAGDGHGAKKDDGHGAASKGTSAKKPSKSTKSAKTAKKGKDTKTASADAHGGGH